MDRVGSSPAPPPPRGRGDSAAEECPCLLPRYHRDPANSPAPRSRFTWGGRAPAAHGWGRSQRGAGLGAELLGAMPCRAVVVPAGYRGAVPCASSSGVTQADSPVPLAPPALPGPHTRAQLRFGVNPTGLGLSGPASAAATGPGCNQSPGSSECLCCERGASAGGSLEKSSVLGTRVPVPKKTAVFRRRFPNS